MGELEFSWPNVRRSIFDMEGPTVDSSTKCFIEHMGMSDFNYDYLSEHYKQAADIIVKSLEMRFYSYTPENLFMPIGYLYRHALELKSKGLLSSIIQCDLCKDDHVMYSHDLVKIWERIKPILIDQWPTADPKPLDNVEALLCDFHKIDKSGQSLRYHILKNGKDVRDKFPKIVRLEMLSEAFSEMYNLLDGCLAHFDNIVEYINDQRDKDW